jgi:hypothetical protein
MSTFPMSRNSYFNSYSPARLVMIYITLIFADICILYVMATWGGTAQCLTEWDEELKQPKRPSPNSFTLFARFS